MSFLLVLPFAVREPPTPVVAKPRARAVVLPEEVKAETFDLNFSTFDVKRTVHDLSDYDENTCCFWCCHPFDTAPCVLPHYFDDVNYIFHGTGHYCSFNCALAHATPHHGKRDQRLLTKMLYRATAARNGGPLPILIPAPPRETLRIFGGIWDIAEFRQEFCFDVNTFVTHAPVIHHVHQAVRTVKELTTRKVFESVHQQQHKVAVNKQKTYKDKYVQKFSLLRFVQ